MFHNIFFIVYDKQDGKFRGVLSARSYGNLLWVDGCPVWVDAGFSIDSKQHSIIGMLDER